MQYTTNCNLKKPEGSDPVSIQEINDNSDIVDTELGKLDKPTFEDYTGSTPVPSAATALAGIKSKTKISTLFSNIKAFCKGCCTLAMIVDNCVTDRADLPGSARQLKALQEQLASLNGEAAKLNRINSFISRQEIACSGDVKLVMRSTDADNACYIEAQNVDGNRLGLFGYFPVYGGWCIDGKAIATK